MGTSAALQNTGRHRRFERKNAIADRRNLSRGRRSGHRRHRRSSMPLESAAFGKKTENSGNKCCSEDLRTTAVLTANIFFVCCVQKRVVSRASTGTPERSALNQRTAPARRDARMRHDLSQQQALGELKFAVRGGANHPQKLEKHGGTSPHPTREWR